MARWGSATANRYPLWCGAVYEAQPRVRDGVVTWRRVESFGGTRSGWRPSGLFVRQLKVVAPYPWMDGVRHGQETDQMCDRVKRGDWVESCGVLGLVRRVARDGSWADVRWRSGKDEWSKRVPCSSLRVLHTIPFAGGTVTDMTRKQELEEQDEVRSVSQK